MLHPQFLRFSCSLPMRVSTSFCAWATVPAPSTANDEGRVQNFQDGGLHSSSPMFTHESRDPVGTNSCRCRPAMDRRRRGTKMKNPTGTVWIVHLAVRGHGESADVGLFGDGSGFAGREAYRWIHRHGTPLTLSETALSAGEKDNALIEHSLRESKPDRHREAHILSPNFRNCRLKRSLGR